jgi:pimeloyl-ACP methyl ester carboxylesterase
MHGVEVFWRASLQTFYSPGFFQKHAGIYELLIEMLSGTYGASADRLTDLLEGDTQALDVAPATRFRCPTLLLAGRQDALFPPHEMAAYRDRCRAPLLSYLEVEGGHAFPFENPSEAACAILAFADQLHAAPACAAHPPPQPA